MGIMWHISLFVVLHKKESVTRAGIFSIQLAVFHFDNFDKNVVSIIYMTIF